MWSKLIVVRRYVSKNPSMAAAHMNAHLPRPTRSINGSFQLDVMTKKLLQPKGCTNTRSFMASSTRTRSAASPSPSVSGSRASSLLDSCILPFSQMSVTQNNAPMNTKPTTSTRSTRSYYSTLLDKDDDEQQLTVSILGPPNAGKSTLFNRLMCKEANRTYKLASDKRRRKPVRSKGRIGSNHPSNRSGGAIVSATPGTTRDRRECMGRIGGTTFTLVDTAGVDGERVSLLTSGKKVRNRDPMEVEMMRQTLKAASDADLIFLLYDAKVGLTTDLDETVRWLRTLGGSNSSDWNESEQMSIGDEDSGGAGTGTGVGARQREWKGKEVVILANKLEGDAWATKSDSPVLDHLADISRIGFGEAIPISAEHGEGLADIAAIIEALTARKRQSLGLPLMNHDDDDNVGNAKMKRKGLKDEDKPLRLAILGRQNVGKSTLVNSLLKQDRVIAGSKPGLTRDSIAVNWRWDDKPVHLVDTAGIRRMAKRDQTGDIEDLAVRDAMRAMKVADVAVLVIDAEARMLQRQELAIADAVLREGRSLVVAANKMDLLIDAEYSKEEYAMGVRDQIETRFPMLRSTPVVAMSSLTGEAVEDLMPVVFKARERWSQTISTALLNRWLVGVVDTQAPPIVRGNSTKIKYIIQTKGRPPTFLLFCNVEELPASYLRFLTRNFQETFQMFGMDVRMAIKKSENPYHDKNASKRLGMGVGGSSARKKRNIRHLKETGTSANAKKGKRRRFQKQLFK